VAVPEVARWRMDEQDGAGERHVVDQGLAAEPVAVGDLTTTVRHRTLRHRFKAAYSIRLAR
jgi:hypothetical protein